VIFILKPGKNRALLSSYCPRSMLDRIGKLFGKFYSLLGSGSCVISSFGWETITARLCSWPASLKHWEGSRQKETNRPDFTGYGYGFDSVWFDGLLYKLTVLNFSQIL
jgi:hypothetical protein